VIMRQPMLVVLSFCMLFMLPARCAPASHSSSVSKTKQGQSAPLSTGAGVVVMHFPQKSIGRIYALPKKWDAILLHPPMTFISDARGEVKLPADCPLRFEPNGRLAENPQVLRQFPADRLEVLEMDGLDINSGMLAEIGRIRGLRHLQLADTDIDDDSLKNFKDLTNLEWFGASETLVKGPGLIHLANCKKLRCLSFSGNSLLPGTTRYFLQFPNLQQLFIRHSLITDADLVHVAKIKTLSDLALASNNGITDSGMKYVAAMPRLSLLWLQETKVTLRGVARLRQLPLVEMSLSHSFDNAHDKALLKKIFPRCDIDVSRHITAEANDAMNYINP
jgi:hypothetical protein